MRAQVPEVRRKLRRLDARRAFVESQIDLELLAAEAERQGLAADPEVRRVLRQVLARRLLDRSLAAPPTEEELRAAFEAHRTEFDRPAERRVSAIVLAARRWKGLAKARAKADELRVEAEAHRADAAHFRSLVERFSDDAKGKLRGGATPYFARGDESVPAAVRAAAFELAEIGDVAVVEVKQAVHVLRLIGRRGPAAASFEAVRPRVQRLVERQRRSAAQGALVDALRRRVKIEVDERALRRVRVP